MLFRNSQTDSLNENCLPYCEWAFIYDRLRLASGLKSASTPQITVWLKGILKSVSFPNSQDLWPIYWLGLGLGLWHTSVTSLDVNWRKWQTSIDLRIWKRTRNRTWIWGLDVDLSLTYISQFNQCVLMIVWNFSLN
jgi:hypothetical protein